jgi:hypothetical protein
MDTKSTFYKVKSYSSNAAWPNVIKAAENYLRRLLSASLHGCHSGSLARSLRTTQDPPAKRLSQPALVTVEAIHTFFARPGAGDLESRKLLFPSL